MIYRKNPPNKTWSYTRVGSAGEVIRVLHSSMVLLKSYVQGGYLGIDMRFIPRKSQLESCS